jgi:hypothetical protein
MKNSELMLIRRAIKNVILTVTYQTARVHPLLLMHQRRIPYSIRKGTDTTGKKLKNTDIPGLYIGLKLNLAEVI